MSERLTKIAHLTTSEREALHSDMAAWAKVMPYNHLGLEYGLSDGIWTRLDKAVERIVTARVGGAIAALREGLEDESLEATGVMERALSALSTSPGVNNGE